MIKQLPLFVSLFLALNYAAEFKREIDFHRCDGMHSTVCFVKQSCLKEKGTDAEAQKRLVEFDFDKDSEQLNDKLTIPCEAAIQMRPFNDQQVIVIMQLTGIDATEMKIEQGDQEVMLSCKKDGAPGTDITFASVEYEGDSNFENKITFCSLLVDTTASDQTKFTNLAGDPKHKATAPSFVFSSESLVYWAGEGEDTKGNNFWGTIKVKCTNKINHLISSPNYILKNVDLTKDVLECPSSQKLLFKSKDGDFIEADKAVCHEKKWKWAVGSTKLDKSDTLEIACIENRFCSTCSDLTVFKCNPADSCKDPEKNKDAKDGCLEYKCKDNKWVVDGVDAISNPRGVYCDKKDGASEPAWFIKDTEIPREITASGATCREKYVCTNKRINLGCSGECPPGKSAPTLDEVNSVFNCTNGGQLYQSDNNVHPTCDHTTGEWKGLTDGDHLYCEVKEKVEEKAEPQSGGGGVVGAIVGIMIAASVVVGGALGYFLWWKPKQARQASKATTSKKSKKSTESGTKKPSDSDPPEKAGSGKEGGVPTDVEKLKTEPVPSGTKTDGAAPATPAAPAAAAPPPPPAAPTPV